MIMASKSFFFLLLMISILPEVSISQQKINKKTPSQLPIIDMHLHAHAADRFGKAGIPNPVTGKPSAAVTDDTILKATIAELKRHNVVKAIAGSSMESGERWR